MCVPSGLTQSYKDKETEAKVRDFLQCGKFYLRIGLVLLKMRNWTSQQAWRKESLVLELSLSFAALASGIIETENVWADNEGLGKLSFEALVSLSKALQEEKTSSSDGGMAPVISELEISDARSLENLSIQLLPVVLPRLKENFKAGTRFINEENLAAAPKTDDLPLAIVSAHQLRWFLKQVGGIPDLSYHVNYALQVVLSLLEVNHFLTEGTLPVPGLMKCSAGCFHLSIIKAHAHVVIRYSTGYTRTREVDGNGFADSSIIARNLSAN